MKKLLLLLLCLPLYIQAHGNDSVIFRKISDEIMLQGTCYEQLRSLTKNIGHRLSGSPEADKAIQWAQGALREAGADSVWLQPVYVPKWVRGKEWLKLQLDENFVEVPVLSLGNTQGTGGNIMEGEIVCVNSFEEFDKLPASDIAGKIVFFNYRFRQDFIQTFQGYGDAVPYRFRSVSKAARRNAAAIIIRSISTAEDDFPHTGACMYEDGTRKIPAVAIGNKTANRLEEACSGKVVKAQILSNCKLYDSVLSYNVIGEIRGREKPDEYIIAGAHLDSWDAGEGAHDDGSGCVQSIEVIRTFKALNIRPRHSIRAVLFMNEENGARGGRAYADSALARNEKHIMAMESDAGGFSPRGIGLDMPEELKTKIRHWAPLFLPYGVYDFSQEEGGVDIGFLKRQQVPLAGLLPDPQRYFDVHHNASDVFEAVNHRELKLGAIVMAQFVYKADKEL